MDEPRYHLGSVVHAKGETLEDFDGPLDVILLLLSKNKIEIQDIQISAILEQYLAYLDEMKRMDMEIASEFIAMASYLMYIKTRMLLSKAEQEEAQSEMDKLVESLQKRQRQDAYQQIQKAAKQLGARMSWASACLPRARSPISRTRPTATGMTAPTSPRPSPPCRTGRSGVCRRR